ncbi:MAG TPA: hypothetical protein VGG59_01495 [Acidobacteriaceae bacterium]|jgi:hypothetical protein
MRAVEGGMMSGGDVLGDSQVVEKVVVVEGEHPGAAMKSRKKHPGCRDREPQWQQQPHRTKFSL